MTSKQKHLLSMQELPVERITEILTTAESFKEVSGREIKKVPALRGKTVVNLFYEPSTRTRTSFELAAKRLSADVVNIAPDSSSATKGESLLDTARNIEAMKTDILVVRHAMAGAPALLARSLSCSVINAGDGAHEHPTQALLDLYTIKEKKGRIDGLTVVIAGDVLHSRVARSNLYGLVAMGANVRLAGPGTMLPPLMGKWIDAAPGQVELFTDFDKAVGGADVIMMLRLQTERQSGSFFPSVKEYARLYGLNGDRVARANPDVLIMHPGPINRGVEISPDVADGLSSVILEQVTNGVAIRMAVLYLLSGGAST
ncbi:MAG TPA: aspartate carbamoyltransferase catalytic subunit [Nitrospiria bacterium]|nr:aspartate carbamoyltransferase catalytic subunit [Nitrospiria bacterium]